MRPSRFTRARAALLAFSVSLSLSSATFAEGSEPSSNDADDDVLRAIAVYDRGDLAGARVALDRALARGPDVEFRSLAETYIDRITPP